MEAKNDAAVMVRMDARMKERLEQIARRHDRSLASLIRVVLADSLDKDASMDIGLPPLQLKTGRAKSTVSSS